MGMKGRILALARRGCDRRERRGHGRAPARTDWIRASRRRRSRSAARSRSPGRHRSTRRSRRPRRRTSTTSTTTAASTGGRSTSRSSTTRTTRRRRCRSRSSSYEQTTSSPSTAASAPRPASRPGTTLNQQKVPQVLLATGDSYWGFSHEEVPVDDRLAARLSGRGEGLRQVHRREHAEREDRRPLPERRVRQELLRGPAGRPRRQEVRTSSTPSRTTSPTRASRSRSSR